MQNPPIHELVYNAHTNGANYDANYTVEGDLFGRAPLSQCTQNTHTHTRTRTRTDTHPSQTPLCGVVPFQTNSHHGLFTASCSVRRAQRPLYALSRAAANRRPRGCGRCPSKRARAGARTRRTSWPRRLRDCSACVAYRQQREGTYSQAPQPK